MKTVQRHMDEIDASSAGETWLVELGLRRGADSTDLHRCERNGGIRSAWKGNRMLAYFIVVRDQLNWTILACHDLSEDLEPQAGTAPAPDPLKAPAKTVEPMDAIQRRDAALNLAHRFGGFEKAHNKAWVIDQMVRILSGDEYEAWVTAQKAGEDGPDTYRWENGICP